MAFIVQSVLFNTASLFTMFFQFYNGLLKRSKNLEAVFSIFFAFFLGWCRAGCLRLFVYAYFFLVGCFIHTETNWAYISLFFLVVGIASCFMGGPWLPLCAGIKAVLVCPGFWCNSFSIFCSVIWFCECKFAWLLANVSVKWMITWVLL